MLSSQFLHWAAGFLEGEGSFRFHRHKPGGGATPEVTAVQVQREPLDRLHAAFGGSVYWRPTHGRQGIHVWQINSYRAMGVMMTLFPLMSPNRKEQIRRAIVEWRARPGTGYANRLKTHCPRGHAYDAIDRKKPRRGSHRGPRATGLSRRCKTCQREHWERNKDKYYATQKARRLLFKTARFMLSA
jgi:hypothetical protein